MIHILKANRNFCPCPIDDGDELFPNGIFEFNVTKMLEYIQNGSSDIALVEIKVSDFYREFSSINESHLQTVDISRPVVIAEISPGRYNLIDGHHRVEKAQFLSRESVSAYKLTVHQHINFLTSRSAYLAYVEYWNDKVRQLEREMPKKSVARPRPKLPS